jgi:glucosyl-dolichyl phosphate glucuronosyltransferase
MTRSATKRMNGQASGEVGVRLGGAQVETNSAPMDTSAHAPSVTVVIACHDEEQWQSIIRAIDSVRAQIPYTPAIVLAVDHNADLSRRLRRQIPGLSVVDNNSGSRGASGTRNAGASVATTDFIAFLDDDEIAEPDWLCTLLEPFGEPDVVGTGGRYLPVWDARKPRWFPDELAWVVGGHHTGMPDEAASVRNVWSGNMAVRADVFHEVGGFRTDFGKVGMRSRPEDTDLCIRMAATAPGGHWKYLPDAKIHHAVPVHRSSFSFYLRRCYAEGRGKIELNDAVGAEGTLDVERDYLRRTIPGGIKTHVRDAVAAAGRAAAIVAGIGAAGTGALVSTAQSKASLRRNR